MNTNKNLEQQLEASIKALSKSVADLILRHGTSGKIYNVDYAINKTKEVICKEIARVNMRSCTKTTLKDAFKELNTKEQQALIFYVDLINANVKNL